MNRATSLLGRLVLVSLGVLLAAASAPVSAAVTTYTDLESFLAAVGGTPVTLENFDQFETGTNIGNQITGVLFSSPNSGSEGYSPIAVISDSSASSRPNMLVGGSVPGVTSQITQVMVLSFTPSISAFAFDLTAYNPAATAASVRFDFDNESSQTSPLANTSDSELTPVFFGGISDRPIVAVTITSGFEGGAFEEYGIDDL